MSSPGFRLPACCATCQWSVCVCNKTASERVPYGMTFGLAPRRLLKAKPLQKSVWGSELAGLRAGVDYLASSDSSTPLLPDLATQSPEGSSTSYTDLHDESGGQSREETVCANGPGRGDYCTDQVSEDNLVSSLVEANDPDQLEHDYAGKQSEVDVWPDAPDPSNHAPRRHRNPPALR